LKNEFPSNLIKGLNTQVLLGEVADEASHMWVADKVTRIAWHLKLIEDMDGYLTGPDLDPHLRSSECGSFQRLQLP
jgi:hypothetical protein